MGEKFREKHKVGYPPFVTPLGRVEKKVLLFLLQNGVSLKSLMAKGCSKEPHWTRMAIMRLGTLRLIELTTDKRCKGGFMGPRFKLTQMGREHTRKVLL